MSRLYFNGMSTGQVVKLTKQISEISVNYLSFDNSIFSYESLEGTEISIRKINNTTNKAVAREPIRLNLTNTDKILTKAGLIAEINSAINVHSITSLSSSITNNNTTLTLTNSSPTYKFEVYFTNILIASLFNLPYIRNIGIINFEGALINVPISTSTNTTLDTSFDGFYFDRYNSSGSFYINNIFVAFVPFKDNIIIDNSHQVYTKIKLDNKTDRLKFELRNGPVNFKLITSLNNTLTTVDSSGAINATTGFEKKLLDAPFNLEMDCV